ncbi:MAG: polynucleotide adenylyltransferase PcnB [Candidatus Thiodiazotropha sp.]
MKRYTGWLKKKLSGIVGAAGAEAVPWQESLPQPLTVPRDEHNISRSNISRNAVKVLYRLNGAGYQAYLVGGGVRDLLLGREPKDFDVATDARPEQVKAVFSNCRLIGRRFRLAHVHFGREIIEVATFRSNRDAGDEGDRQLENGMLLSDNVYGTLEEDAQRRDFTINALYYSVEDFSVIDFAGGIEDLRKGVIRLLGNPESRFREDPVRLLRAVRFAAKLGFVVEPETERPMAELAPLLRDIPAARLFEEVLKLFLAGSALETFEKLRHYQLFGQLFPATEEALTHQDHEFPITFVNRGLLNTDRRIQEDKPVTPAFLFAVLLWEPVRLRAEALQGSGMHPYEALQTAATEVLAGQTRHVSIPKRFSYPMREIWQLQHRFFQRNGKRPQRLMTHPRFRAAYDFFVLRAEAGEVDQADADWWIGFVEQPGESSSGQQQQATSEKPTKRRRRRRRRPKKTTSDNE